MRKSHRILLIGVGRSRAIEVLYEMGFHSIVAIDISPTIIHKLQAHYSDKSGVDFYIMDVRELSTFKDKSFSLVIDKGCLDALFCGVDFIESSERSMNEIYRVLEDDGSLISVSYASFASRAPYFRRLPWRIESCPLTDGEGLTLFNLVKSTDREEEGSPRSRSRLKPSTTSSNPSTTTSTPSSGLSSQEKRKLTKTRSLASHGGDLQTTASEQSMADLVAETADLES